ncbi:serine/threonine-protein kinase, partial [Streptomyces tricolor]
YGWPQPTPEERKARRRRAALISAAGVAGGALLVALLAWSVMEAKGRLDDRDTAASRTSTTGPSARSSSSASASGEKSDSSSDSSGTSGSGTGDAGTSASPRNPRPEGFAAVWLDAKNSFSLSDKDPKARKDRKGDIRFDCQTLGCRLKSDSVVFMQMYGGPGTTLDDCRLMLNTSTQKHDWGLSGAAAGTEFCMKDDKGNIGLYVIQTKSTAMPDLAFLSGDLTIWRNAA